MRYYPRRKDRKVGRSCIDLFAGAGGLAEGFRQAGWSVLLGTDVNRDAGATFRENFPESSFFEGPIDKLEVSAILEDTELEAGELDCLIGGPPCQSFSYNNHHRSSSDQRARLFTHYLRLVAALKPKTLVMENVPGMLTIGGGRVIDEIRSELESLGYDITIRIVYAEDFGVPQKRRRLFIVGSCVGDSDGLIPPGTHGPSEKPASGNGSYCHSWTPPRNARTPRLVTVWDAISDLPRLGGGGGVQAAAYRGKPRNALQKRARRGSNKLFNHVSQKLTDGLLERVESIPEGGNWRNIPRHLLTSGMKRARPTDHTKRYGRLSRRGLASTILTKCDPHWGAYLHPTQLRTISVREAARLQGFPDRFRFVGSSVTKHYEQVGNAVPPPIARAIAKAAKRHILQSSASGPIRNFQFCDVTSPR